MRFDRSFAQHAMGLCLFGLISQSAVAQTIVINEVDADTPGSDVAEFIELYDGGDGNTDLTGLVLVLFNGNADSYYAAYDLDDLSTTASGYFVLCFNAANTANCNSDALVTLQNGADAVALYAGDATDYDFDSSVSTDNLIDAIVYDTDDDDDAGLLTLLNDGQPQVDENGSGNKDGHSNQRCANGTGGARNTDTYAQFVPTPGTENLCEVQVVATPYKIHEIQGSGADSPMVDELVLIEGIVVGDFQDGGIGEHGDLNGFHVQEEVGDTDADPMTSEGIFVFDGFSPAVDVQVGDIVQVEGVVSEYNGLTEITSYTGVTRLSSGNPLPTVTALSLPVAGAEAFEAYEGMYVSFGQALVISEYFNFGRYGEIVLSSVRHSTPTAEVEPGPDAIANAALIALDRITLDDGQGAQNADPAIHPNGAVFDLGNLFRGGDTVANVTGVVDFTRGRYRIQPTQGANYTSNNPRLSEPDTVGGDLRVASANVLNYFTTLDYPRGDPMDNMCGPFGGMGCRGADDAVEQTRQRDKIIASLVTMDADIVGLVEIENNFDDHALSDLVSGLNDATALGTYDYVATGYIGSDAIRVALVYKPASASPVGAHAILDSTMDPRFQDDKNRPALAQTFMDNATGGVFTVVVNHFKSKGSPCNEDDFPDPNTGDGSGNCNLTREDAALALVDWLAGDPTGSGDADFLVIGDLNAYDKEDPIDALVAGGYTDLVLAFKGEDAYSYTFDGGIGYLDHALASASLLDQVTGTTEWHINADEPSLLDYDTSFKKDAQDALYEPNAFRSSDHDPVIVGLAACEFVAPTIDEIFLTPDVLWPADHKYVDVSAEVTASDNFDPDLAITLVSVTSSEPDNGDHDGNTVNDIVIVDDFNFMLRAERAHQHGDKKKKKKKKKKKHDDDENDGRIYTITYQAMDSCGNSSMAEGIVTVPHDKGKKKKKSKKSKKSKKKKGK